MNLPALLIPVENQVRELDAKLLLACLAVQQRFPVYIGSKTEIDNRIYTLPRGIYLAKSFAPQNVKMLKLLKGLGHMVVAWDEEGLVHYPSHVYWGRRITPDILQYLDHIIAWGKDYVELLESHQTPFPVPLSDLGNPRGDLLRPELQFFYQQTIANLRDRYGPFILINTNFPSVNSFDPSLQLAQKNPENQSLTLARGSQGMSYDFAKGRYEYKYRLFQAFLTMVEDLAQTFPGTNILLRPHPSENFTPWLALSRKHANVIVESKGNVIPWIMASAVLIHNGCTTGVEGVALGKPVMTYQPFPHEEFETDLPNRLSVRCDNLQNLVARIQQLHQSPEDFNKDVSRAILRNYLTAMDGPLASERIVECLLKIVRNSGTSNSNITSFERLRYVFKSLLRHYKKFRQQKSGSLRYSKEFGEQRFPEILHEELSNKIHLFDEILKFTNHITLRTVKKNIFRMESTKKV